MRGVVFLLAASSIWSLLAEFYGLCSMRTFTVFATAPSLLILLVLGVADLAFGTQKLWQAVLIGTLAGLSAAVAYDLFRLPFVYSREWHLIGIVPAMPLYKVFPAFGAMILGQSGHQSHFSPAAQGLGWAYHFSNGATLGIMYLALIGDPGRRHWSWGILLAVGLELGMLFTPYPAVFGIPLTRTFVVVTLAAHLIFGIVLGLLTRSFWIAGKTLRESASWEPAAPAM